MADGDDRLDNGVRVRRDGQGDAWANTHREGLGNKFYLQDIDALFGMEVFGANTGDRLFIEYEPDNYENRFNAIREFALVAMFDRKATLAGAMHPGSKVSRDLYLWLCRTIGLAQPIAPKFFLVIGESEPPWQMIEIDINTGRKLGEPSEVDGDNFRQVWNQLGLAELRSQLRRYINTTPRQN
jgi:hypothetical protein